MNHDPEDEVTVISAEGIGKGVLRGNTIHLVGTLKHIRKVRKNIDHTADGVLYIHPFGTGFQELVFANHDAAWKHAQSSLLEYRGPR